MFALLVLFFFFGLKEKKTSFDHESVSRYPNRIRPKSFNTDLTFFYNNQDHNNLFCNFATLYIYANLYIF